MAIIIMCTLEPMIIMTSYLLTARSSNGGSQLEVAIGDRKYTPSYVYLDFYIKSQLLVCPARNCIEVTQLKFSKRRVVSVSHRVLSP